MKSMVDKGKLFHVCLLGFKVNGHFELLSKCGPMQDVPLERGNIDFRKLYSSNLFSSGWTTLVSIVVACVVLLSKDLLT